VGGIVDQIAPGTGVLLDDPADLGAFGDALDDLLGRPDQILQLGEAAKRHVLDNFIGDLHLLRYAALLEKLVAQVGRPTPPEGGTGDQPTPGSLGRWPATANGRSLLAAEDLWLGSVFLSPVVKPGVVITEIRLL
jgi:hypothetical protein